MTPQQIAAIQAAEEALIRAYRTRSIGDLDEIAVALRLLRAAGKNSGWEGIGLPEVIRSPRPGDCVVGPVSKDGSDRRIKMECVAIKMDKSGVTHTSVKVGIQSNFNVAGTSDLNSVSHWARLASTPGTELIHAADRRPLPAQPVATEEK